MNVKIRNKFKYSIPHWLVIFIINYGWCRILEISRYDEVTDLTLKILGKSINSIPLFMKGIFMKCLPILNPILEAFLSYKLTTDASAQVS